MKTRRQVETELILDFLADCRLKDTSGQYHAMLERAAEMAQRPGFECKIEGTYVYVPSGTHAGVRYEVNGFCHCPAATHDPKHLCKHYALAKAWRHAQERMEDAETAGFIHTHRMLCGHATGHVVCYDSACPDPPEVRCPMCAAGECETPAEVPEAAMVRCATPWLASRCGHPCVEPDDGRCDACAAREAQQDRTLVDAAALAQHAPEVVPDPAHALDAHPVSAEGITAERVRQQANAGGDTAAPPLRSSDYEPNPSHQHICAQCGMVYPCWLDAPPHAAPWQARCPTCVQLPMVQPQALGEAPASVNTFICVAGYRTQITLRGTDIEEVLERLTRVLERYPRPSTGEL